ncbi:hypothetical protein AXF42_Ash009659 [Apostasia shenzhenica]|uniref:Ribosomal RNA-processing protein 7 C-terminal domain-containing protein n=1 Tax=Apostasia shenzhenica TaxID=1088818 RepID=A0A2I0AWP7_9ASPA|nr:hypothetical protein AXF42_Ash009659 [Apostasia shenzhenica]
MLLAKAKRKKAKVSKGFAESAVVSHSPEIEERAGIKKDLKKRKLDHLKKKSKASTKRKKRKKESADGALSDQFCAEAGRWVHNDISEGSIPSRKLETDSSMVQEVATGELKIKDKKLVKDRKHRKKGKKIVEKPNTEENRTLVDEEKVDEITSVDEDCSKGMKKWLRQYEESRPGLKVLQQRIDDFVTAYEERQEQERKEKAALAAEGGWTVVVHHKGRKKTTDAETGTTVGSVAPAAVMEKMSKKKTQVALDFYRFQKREAKRNEVMMLQRKFEQDKKRIQQLRAARKFRPY